MNIIIIILAVVLSLAFVASIVGIIVPFKSLGFKNRKEAAQSAVACLVFLIAVLAGQIIYFTTAETDQTAEINDAFTNEKNIVQAEVMPKKPHDDLWQTDALKAIISEPKVVEASFPNNSRNSFWVSMRDDGSKRDGFAEYLCLVLRDNGMPSDRLVVIRIWDAVQLAREKFKELGRYDCKS